MIYFENSLNGAHEVLHVKDVKFLSEKKGSYGLTYGLIGAGIGLSSVLFTQKIYNTKDVNWVPMYLGFTAGGALLGALIGFSTHKWEILHFPEKSISYSIRIMPIFNANYCGLGLHVNF